MPSALKWLEVFRVIGEQSLWPAGLIWSQLHKQLGTAGWSTQPALRYVAWIMQRVTRQQAMMPMDSNNYSVAQPHFRFRGTTALHVSQACSYRIAQPFQWKVQFMKACLTAILHKIKQRGNSSSLPHGSFFKHGVTDVRLNWQFEEVQTLHSIFDDKLCAFIRLQPGIQDTQIFRLTAWADWGLPHRMWALS